MIAEQQRAGMEQSPPGVGGIGEAAFDDRGDGNAAVAFLEGAVLRAGATDELAARPAVPAGDAAGRQRGVCGFAGDLAHGPKIAIFPKLRKRPKGMLLT